MLYYGTYNGKKISKGLDIKGGNLIQYLCCEERDNLRFAVETRSFLQNK